jgi:hypothetical protein
MLLFSINRSRGYENPSLDIIVTEHCSTGGCPLEEAFEHCYLIQSAISVAISYIISVYCEDYAGYFTVILSFLAFRFCSAYFIYLVSCRMAQIGEWSRFNNQGQAFPRADSFTLGFTLFSVRGMVQDREWSRIRNWDNYSSFLEKNSPDSSSLIFY